MIQSDFKTHHEYSLHLLSECNKMVPMIRVARALRISRPTIERYISNKTSMNVITYDRLIKLYDLLKKERELTK